MTRLRPMFARRRMAGLSLIEMMIALIMALIVAAGIITVFASTSSSNKVQQQMAALQEEGRFAIHSLRNDLANANGSYCANTGGNASMVPSGTISLDSLNAPTVAANTIASVNAAFADNTTPLDDPGNAFALPSFLFMRGYDCTAATCSPVDPHTIVAGIPAMGNAIGDRVRGTSVLTIRYLRPNSGWAIVPPGSAVVGSTITANPDGSVASISLNPMAGEPSVATFGANDLAMLADCSAAYVMAVSGQGGNTLTVTGANYAKPKILDLTSGAAPRVFDFNDDFQTVTYYLKVVCADNSNPCAHTTGELERRVNGTDQPMVRGIERMDFRYGIIDANGNTKFLTANQVDTATDTGGAIPCPPGVQLASNVGYTATTGGGSPDQGCLWRAVKFIEAHILMDGQAPLYTLTPAEMNYIYSIDGDTTPQLPTDASRGIQPSAQGFPNQLLRREFTTVVALRNFNP